MIFHLSSYRSSDGNRSGIVCEGKIYDVAVLLDDEHYASLTTLLDSWTQCEPRLNVAAKAIVAGGHQKSARPDAKLMAPISATGQIYAGGGNYTDHLEAMMKILGTDKPADPRANGGQPWFFVKPNRSCVIGPAGEVRYPTFTKVLDYELELAVVIGQTGRNIPVEDALSYVCGYTIANDLSARDMMKRPNVAPDSFSYYDWIGQKAFDGSCPMGPWITPAAFIEDPQNLALKLWVNNELRQNSHTSRMVFSVAEQIAWLSGQITLNPGDVIMTGTPAGTGLESGRPLKVGDKVRMEIEKIGILEHVIV
jgi:2-keto-4-pentenoate hydratase/2-oxohepta-3-ene-1,7-dioic acid hydratase in catechol pathway